MPKHGKTGYLILGVNDDGSRNGLKAEEHILQMLMDFRTDDDGDVAVESHAPIKFYEFSDRIEISSAGGLYGKARPENFPNENDYRNPTLAEAAKNLGYVNTFNVGVKRSFAALEKNGNPKLVFTVNNPTSFTVIIPKK